MHDILQRRRTWKSASHIHQDDDQGVSPVHFARVPVLKRAETIMSDNIGNYRADKVPGTIFLSIHGVVFMQYGEESFGEADLLGF